MKNRRLKKNNSKIIMHIIEIALFIILIFCCVKIVSWFINNMNNKKVLSEISKSIKIDNNVTNVDIDNKYSIDFHTLKEKNPDTVGFIKVNGTNIEYVVVKGKDNSYYLNHNFDKSYNVFGWIFANYKNKFDGNDRNITIFGHNMTDGSMFATLKNTQTSAWQDNSDNHFIAFITEDSVSLYQVFSTYTILDEALFFKSDFYSDDEYLNFLNTIKSRSNFNYNVELNIDDKILTLSTCASNNKYRVVLHAKKVNVMSEVK